MKKDLRLLPENREEEQVLFYADTSLNICIGTKYVCGLSLSSGL
jgi:hypothetical protein